MKYRVYDLEMTALSPIYSGEIKNKEKDAKKKNHVIATRIDNGYAVVNIHGSMRANLERILRDKGENVCDTGRKGAMPCGRCVLCDLFGALGKSGRTIIDDMVSVKPASEIIEETTHVRLNRETKSTEDTILMEEVTTGSVFHGRILIFNPQARDDELINTAINAINEFGVGGWVNRGHGKVAIKIVAKTDKNLKDLA
jgi:CRISPR/Cas system CSM-associated protein Csm3 (group 7 of RAMP superfamily)